MDDAGFRAFVERAIPRRAERWVRRGIWDPARAIEASREGYAQAFPQGRLTPHQHLLDVIEQASGARIGEVWCETRETGGKVDFNIQWLYIEPEFRRRGFGAEVLRLLEEDARRRGAERTRLIVWMDNPDAIRLYSKLGYVTQTMGMAKSLTPGPPT